MVYGCRRLSLRGRRLNETKAERTSVCYGEDRRLSMRVESAEGWPRLATRLHPCPPANQHLQCLAGELVQFSLSVANAATVSSGPVLLAADPADAVAVRQLANQPPLMRLSALSTPVFTLAEQLSAGQTITLVSFLYPMFSACSLLCRSSSSDVFKSQMTST